VNEFAFITYGINSTTNFTKIQTEIIVVTCAQTNTTAEAKLNLETDDHAQRKMVNSAPSKQKYH
jgi:hypothetical protein